MFEIVNGHTHTHTDTRTPARVLSYKLTLWAFGSGELKNNIFVEANAMNISAKFQLYPA